MLPFSTCLKTSWLEDTSWPVDGDTVSGIVAHMVRAAKLLDAMRANPRADWTPENVRTVARAHGLTIRQRGTSHAVLTNALGRHLTVPMHKPIKPVYVRQLVELVEEVDEV